MLTMDAENRLLEQISDKQSEFKSFLLKSTPHRVESPISKVVSYDELYFLTGLKKGSQLTRYQEEDIARQLMAYFTQERFMHTECFTLPSLSSLAEGYQIPITEFQKAFRLLKFYGFDVLMPGYFGHISVWPAQPHSQNKTIQIRDWKTQHQFTQIKLPIWGKAVITERKED